MATYREGLTNGQVFSAHEEMYNESLRLSTFINWPLWGAKRPTELAENGFYHSGERDRVVCFSCGGEIDNWTIEDNVKGRHKQMYPHCAFVKGLTTSNMKMGLEIEDVATNIEDISKFIPNSCSANGLRDIEEEVSSFTKFQNTTNQTQTGHTGDLYPEQTMVHEETGMGPIDEVNPQFVCYESYRLRTFTNKWPEDSFISPASLARAGFYFVSRPDRVQCAFCRGRLLNWKPTDDPMSEHRLHFPECPFVQGRNVGIVTAEETRSSVQLPKVQEETSSKSHKLGVILERSKHPEFSTLTARMETFKTWQKERVISADTLARAGFYYVGYSDNVRCFFCDGGLRNWEAADNPCYEHARWFSKCGFIKLQMGQEYIDKILSESKAQVVSENVQPTNDIPKALDSSMARTVIAMGFDQELVAQVLKRQRTKTGSNFSSATEHLNALLEEEEGMEVEEKTESRKTKRSLRRKHKKKLREAEKLPHSEDSSPEPEVGQQFAMVNDEQGQDDEELLGSMVEQSPEVQALLEEYQRVREERLCKVCMDEEAIVVFLPCGHLVCCASCAPALRSCPICRTLIKGTVRIYTT